MTKTPFLDYHNSAMLNEETMPERGLCDSLLGMPNFNLIGPTDEDKSVLVNEELSPLWWGSGLPYYHQMDKFWKYTPLRQTLVLLLAVMNDEY